MPPNSEVTSIGSHAGGTSRFADPIIAASRYIISGSKEVLDFLCGTKFYIPSEKKYLPLAMSATRLIPKQLLPEE